MHLPPAHLACEKAGGLRALSRFLGIRPGAIGHWKKNGGRIPAKRQLQILALDLKLTPHDLIYGGVIHE